MFRMGMDIDIKHDIDRQHGQDMQHGHGHGHRLLPDRQGQPTLAEELAEVSESELKCL